MTGYDEVLKSLNATVRNVVLALFACVLFFGSCILTTADIQPKTPDGQPLIVAVGMMFAIALGIYTIKHMTKKK